MRPVALEMLNLGSVLCWSAATYEMNVTEAIWRVNCFRIRNRSLGVFISRIMYCKRGKELSVTSPKPQKQRSECY